MTARYFVDTNVFLYAFDRLAGPKHEKARRLIEDLWESGEGVISTQVLQEFCLNARRKSRHQPAREELRRVIESLLTWQLVVNGGASTLKAWENEERYQVSFWDGLILQAAHVAGADVLYTEDLSDGRVYGSVRVVNPLK
jgi:predicted nucleic acid-binding protein